MRVLGLSGFIVLPVQLSIQTTESLQNKVDKENTKQEESTHHNKITPQQMWGKRNKKRRMIS